MNKKKIDFTTRIYLRSISVNLFSAVLISFFSSILAGLKTVNLFSSVAFSFTVTAILQFTLYLFLVKSRAGKIDEGLSLFENGNEMSVKSKTILFKKLMSFPKRHALFTSFFFLVVITILCSIAVLPQIFNLKWQTSCIYGFGSLYGIYICGILTLSYSENIANLVARKIVKDQISDAEVKQKKYFGISMTARIILFLVIPALLGNGLFIFILIQGYKSLDGLTYTPSYQVFRVYICAAEVIILHSYLCMKYYKTTHKNILDLTDATSNLLKNYDSQDFAETSLSDEIQHNTYLLNNVLTSFRTLIYKASDIGSDVLRTTDNLSVIATQVSSTALVQSADVKEILSTMEDSNSLSQNIANRILHVSGGADDSKNDIEESLELLHQSISKMEEINSSNDKIREGIKNLTQQIDNVDDIVTMIKDIADQTRIIAFNAELEAVSAGNEGKNFHIIATEIRRLAANTMTSINDIQQYIEKIQSASRTLINSSQEGTTYIQQGKELTSKLETHFAVINETSSKTFNRANEIAAIIDQQTSSFNQIVITLKQISAGIESFTVSTKTISDTANLMKSIASALDNITESESED